MDRPMIVVNFKTYASASGAEAEALLKAMEAHADGPATFVAVASVNLARVTLIRAVIGRAGHHCPCTHLPMRSSKGATRRTERRST